MLEQWSIVASPSKTDPRRFTLLVKADLEDVRAIIGKFGAMCGRPQKERRRREYNYTLYLHGLTAGGRERIENLLQSMSAPGQAASTSADSDQTAPVAESAAAESQTPQPQAAPEAASPAQQNQEPAAAPQDSQDGLVDLSTDFPSSPEPPAASAPAAEPSPPSEPAPAPESAAEPSDELPSVPPAPPSLEIQALSSAEMARPLASEPVEATSPASVPPAIASPSPTPVPVEPPAPVAPEASPAAQAPGVESAPAVGDAGGAAPQPATPARAESVLWGALQPLDPACTFDTLSVGPFNRFAHAASMAVVSNPGTMYNPLLLSGVPGSGKSHMLMAIARAIQDSNPGSPVFFTTGSRLSRAVRCATAAGRMAELEAYVKKSKALMIDDVHLMAISEHIQPVLVAILSCYFKSSKHVAMTSVYPPRSLGSLEEALKFQISAGWAVELKTPNPETQKVAIRSALARTGIKYEDSDENAFQEGLAGNFFELGRWSRRLLALQDLRGRAGQSPAMPELLSALFIPMGQAGGGPSIDEVRAQGAETAAPPGDAGPSAKKTAVFFPKGAEEFAHYMLRRFQGAARLNGLDLTPNQSMLEPYDPSQHYGVPFKLADACDQAGVQAVLMLGPTPGSEMAGREGEFLHALEHILSGMDMPLGWVPFVRVHEAIPYFRALLDLHPLWSTKR